MDLILYINKNEFWSKEIADIDEKDNELIIICPKDIKIGNALDLYNALNGDAILNKYIDKSKKNENEIDNDNIKKKEIKEEDEFEIINTEDTQADEKKGGEQVDNIFEEDEEKEEEEEEEENDEPRGDY